MILQNGLPGKDWLCAFKNRWGLSLKLPSALEKSRKIATSDPGVIYPFYDLLESEIKRLGIGPECIFNADETNLTMDVQRMKVLAPRGEKASRTQAGSGRDSVSVMAAVSAAGDVSPPLIIFKGI